MHPDADLRLGFQPDIYQRYGFLARLVEAVLGAPGDHTPPEASGARRYRLLDVGSGPARLVETFLPEWIEASRADVTTFGDSSIIQIPPEGPLPFPDDAFDLVVALDMLEHVPADRRAGVLEECQRVAGRALIVGGPVSSPDVAAAERAFAEFAQAVSARELEFLAEHARFGLPKSEDIVDPLEARGWHVVTIENSPLAEWQVFNAVDFLYASDVGDGEPKRATNALINRQAVFRRESEPHYRLFVCAFRDEADAALARTLAASPAIVGPPLSALELASNGIPLLQRLQADLRKTRSALETIIGAKDTHIGELTDAISQLAVDAQELNQRLAELQKAAAEKEAALSAITEEAAAWQARNDAIERTLESKELLATSLERQLEALRAFAASLEQDLAARSGTADRLTREVAELQARTALLEGHLTARGGTADRLTREVAELQAALAAMRSSLWWKAAGPGRVIMRHVRSLLRRSARSPRTGAELTSNSRDWELLAASPLFDREWYQSQTPETDQAEDPLAHYLNRGRQQGRNPHPLFDAAFYLQQNPDVESTGVDPLSHYIMYGAAEGRTPHPLFDATFYLQQNPDVAAAGADPLVHYIVYGSLEGRHPHPLFDSTFYLAENADVAAAGHDPLSHYVAHGASEGRRPHPLFDVQFYLAQGADVTTTGGDPLTHYLTRGASEGLDPHPLFDTTFYCEQNPDVAAAGVNPLAHFVLSGAREGRNPHPLFDTTFYREQNPDVVVAGVNPLVHYLATGGREGRDPHPEFDSSFYLESNPDVSAAGVNPLVHFVRLGRDEGRMPRPPRADTSMACSFYVPPRGLLPWFDPLNLSVSQPLSSEPRLNVLLPGLGMRHLSGGPNTALALSGLLALEGVRIRLISTDQSPDRDRAPLWAHMGRLIGTELPPGLELVDACDRSSSIEIGNRDVFLATAWWTAQQAKYAVKLTKHERFVYLIQDYEALLHPASTQQALALETYGLDHIPVVNSEWLAGFLVQERVGRFADPEFAGRMLVFQPAVDRAVFHPRERQQHQGRRRLLFYARPTNGQRNLFELGLAALQKAIADGTLDPAEWEFVAIGEAIPPVPLGSGAILRPAPWWDLHEYARRMRDSDLLLSLMLSPHPSYPPLEMAASAGVAVTTVFGSKSAEALAGVSPNILGVEPTIEGIAGGLEVAVERLGDWPARIEGARIGLPADWNSSLGALVPRLIDELAFMHGAPRRSGPGLGTARIPSAVAPAFQGWPLDEYHIYRLEAHARRLHEYPAGREEGLVSLLTSVWNTRVPYLEQLADSVISQDSGPSFEWVVLDNGSSDPATRRFLQHLATADVVRFHRVDTNLGIVGGMRYCLEHASNRYIAPLDSDDLLTPDCIRVITHALRRAGYPAFAFSDEDKLAEKRFCLPYFKPGWDRVLFANSCYIAHLGVIDREIALRLEAYTDPEAEGSHDWDTFSRFLLAGYEPLHVPEVLYSWRMHEGSTSGNIASKSFIHASQRRVVAKLVNGLTGEASFRVEPSPLFDGTPDWWISRDPADSPPLTTILIGGHPDEAPRVQVPAGIPHEIVSVAGDGPVTALSAVVMRCADERRLVHLLWRGTEPDDTRWFWEAVGQFELFPDAAIVGGRIFRHGRVLSAASYFGFGRGCDSPDRGRFVHDPGYFAQMLKPHSASAVPVQHCVVEASVLREFLLARGSTNVPMSHLGAWLAAFARTRGRRVIYTPFLSATATVDLEGAGDGVDWATFRRVHAALLPEETCFSPRLGLSAATAYRGVPDEVRRAELLAADRTDHTIALDADRNTRAIVYPDVPRPTTFSLLTGVYARTPVDYFERLADSLLSQTLEVHQWVIFADGPIPEALDVVLSRLAGHSRVTLVRHQESVGIVAGLRRAFEHATGEFIVPVDHDDLLESDALQVLAAGIAHMEPDLVYSDEDTLAGDVFTSPFQRPDFDPVLNLETSYIWHLCAFRRDRAAQLSVYSDQGAEYCHDWDTVTRFASAEAKIAHVPHVLYHWRTHADSQSYSGTQLRGSIESSQHVLRRGVDRQARPELYELRTFPIFRGAEEWYIARREEAPPLVDLVVLARNVRSPSRLKQAINTRFPFHQTSSISCHGWGPGALEQIAANVGSSTKYVVITSDRYDPVGDAWPWEAIRLLELHPEVAVVSGRVVDDRGTVIDAGRRSRNRGVPPNDFEGLHRLDPGPFALALKPHSIDQPCEALLVVDATFLLATIDGSRQEARSSLGQLLATAARLHGRRIAYSPLIEVVSGSDGARRPARSAQVPIPEAEPVSRIVRGQNPEHAMPPTDGERAAYDAAMQRRRERLLSDLVLSGLRGVEVGPLSRPVVRRHESEVYYVDHCSTEELKSKYSGDHAHIDGIEEVDFIWADRPLVEVLGDKAPLDFIVAAHVIEHVPDLAGWLTEMAEALKIGGRLLLIVPDKRFTFDILRRLSSFEEVTCAQRERRRRPGLRLILDHFANVVKAETHYLWEDYRVADDLRYHHGPEFLELAFHDHAAGKYIDVHCWVFTPWHFMHLMGRMVKEFRLPFDLRYFLTTQPYDLEFYVHLEKVETPGTDWDTEARAAREGALWPTRFPVVPADGVLPQMGLAEGSPATTSP